MGLGLGLGLGLGFAGRHVGARSAVAEGWVLRPGVVVLVAAACQIIGLVLGLRVGLGLGLGLE